MAFSAHKDARMMEELREDDAAVDAKAKTVADAILAGAAVGRKACFFTGAGISRNAGIPDYRSPDGVWTCAAQNRPVPSRGVEMIAAVPTATHMAIAELVRRGLARVISQNVDGLHRKSGIPADSIAELHGNSTIEECAKCGKRYSRDFQIHGGQGHYTGRKCVAEGCDGECRDTIINFGENLPAAALNAGFFFSEQASAHICLGSSLTVRPACDMPVATKERGGLLAIVNLQRTPLDAKADVRVHSDVDAFVARLMAHLGVPIPPFALRRRIVLWRAPDSSGRDLFVSGIDTDGTPQTLFEAVSVSPVGVPFSEERFPFVDTLGRGEPTHLSAPVVGGDAVRFVGRFFGHYDEPDILLELPRGVTLAAFDAELPVGHRAGAAAADASGMKWEWTVTPVAEPQRPSYEKGAGPERVDGISAPLKDGTGIDYSNWFAVTPLDDCPHTKQVAFRDGIVLDPAAPCGTCSNVGENMQCLVCFAVFCGRHVKKHMLQHHDETGHPLVVGFADLSIWCYDCNAYISPSNRRLSLIYRLLHNAKFHCEPGAASS